MAGRKSTDIPPALARARDRFEDWRLTRDAGERIPDTLWSLAVRMADAHGFSRTATVLKLDYYSLKKRLTANNSRSANSPAASPATAFIELPPAAAGSLPSPAPECVVEFADGSGASMRVHLRGCDAPDLIALSRCFWKGE